MNAVIQNVAIPGVMKRAVASGLFVSLCTFMAPDGLLVDAGQPSGNYVAIAGLADIPCIAPPMGEARLQATTMRDQDDIQSFGPLHVLLSGWYPALKLGVSKGWVAVIDGDTYILEPGYMTMGAENDSQSQMTRIAVRFGAV